MVIPNSTRNGKRIRQRQRSTPLLSAIENKIYDNVHVLLYILSRLVTTVNAGNNSFLFSIIWVLRRSKSMTTTTFHALVSCRLRRTWHVPLLHQHHRHLVTNLNATSRSVWARTILLTIRWMFGGQLAASSSSCESRSADLLYSC